MTAIKYCEGLSLAGHDDWRLPNIKELNSIVDYGKYNPAIDETFFPNTNFTEDAAEYWSSTTSIADGLSTYSFGCFVGFDNGWADEDTDKTSKEYVRCVRGGQ